MKKDEYLNTINRLEPDVCAIDATAFYASAAISLKRIADSIERQETAIVEMLARIEGAVYSVAAKQR